MERVKVTAEVEIDYLLKGQQDSKQLIILLHGYAENAKVMLKHCASLLQEQDLILSINAPFPVTQKLPIANSSDQSFSISKFAWYFYDPVLKKYYIDFEYSSDLIISLIHKLGLSQKKIKIIGFSQGGYLSIHVARKMPAVNELVGLNCNYRLSSKHKFVNLKVEMFNGDCDLIVDPKKARETHSELLRMGCTGNHYLVANETHKLSPSFMCQVKALA